MLCKNNETSGLAKVHLYNVENIKEIAIDIGIAGGSIERIEITENCLPPTYSYVIKKDDFSHELVLNDYVILTAYSDIIVMDYSEFNKNYEVLER